MTIEHRDSQFRSSTTHAARAPVLSSSRWVPLPVALAALAALIVAGCMTRPPSPVSDRSPSREALTQSAAPSPPASQEPEAPPPTHTVKRGETLYQIALDNGLDYRELAAWNNIENVNVIRIGRVLVLAAPGTTTAPSATVDSATGTVTAGLVTAPSVTPTGANGAAPADNGSAAATIAPSTGRNTLTYKAEPKALKVPYSTQALAQAQQSAAAAPSPVAQAAAPAPSAASMTIPAAPAAPPTATPVPAPREDSARVPEIDESVEWSWPTTGKVISGFSDSANLKGIDIAGKAGQAVMASGAGKVVYAGTGLRGYGKLIIIKHNNTFLSAYAHNREILVKEGQQVTKGQKIAEMGDTDTDQTKLHFEIRRLGKPVDPAKYLPPA